MGSVRAFWGWCAKGGQELLWPETHRLLAMYVENTLRESIENGLPYL